jgi:hypothetical protein
MFVNAAARAARLVILGALGMATVLCAPASANVTPLGSTIINYTDASRSTCESPAYAGPYRSLGDSRTYVLAPSGSFTGGGAPGWQLAGGAHFTSDSARGTSLALPAGASAITPGFCVDLDYPHMRFAHKVVGTGASNLEIRTEVVYPQLRRPEWTEVKQFDGYQGDPVSSGWRITPDVDMKPDFGGSVPGARYVALRFTAVKKARTSAKVMIDDVFIDPRMRS